ncbi:MAG: bifunctional pyr operon transcriptional regulator/uracil phosphoribosyltransferase PyrR [Bacteroidetes bacterium]|jgi:pyrimidine operon attenuation protein/uracil phosphoribosyltransferase|nr:bifunctional pyr operon transcriptional regulator/uracil phosphoribosyltransferase PyrR [Bacteroidota bacterium]
MSTLIIPAERTQRILSRLAHEVVERNRGAENVVVFGILRRGAALARALAREIEQVEGDAPAVHDLDVTPFRDDRDRSAPTPSLPEDAPDVTDRDVILVDDVLFTGRTARAALDAIVQYGRPRSIQLAVLIDRGHREYPIQPDYVGRVIPTKHKERVTVAADDDVSVYVEE